MESRLYKAVGRGTSQQAPESYLSYLSHRNYPDYQERFLWRFDFKRLRRLWLFILRRRFFLRLPMCKLLVEISGNERRGQNFKAL